MKNIYITKNGKKLIKIKNSDFLYSRKLKQNVEVKKVGKLKFLDKV